MRIDGQSHRGPGGEVDHAASAKANLRAIGDDLRLMGPNHTSAAINLYAEGAARHDMEHMGYRFGGPPSWLIALKGIAMLPFAVAADAAELAIGPLLAVKDAADAAVHGIVAGLRPKHR